MTPILLPKTLFGQEAIKALLVELGGKATSEQLRELAEKRYPHSSLPRRVTEYLNRMHKRYEADYDAKTRIWSLKE